MSHTLQKFLVIGAGPVGLGAAKAMKEAGIPYVQAEATDHVGGNWAHGVYASAHIISSRDTTQYTDFPMPRDYPDFPSAKQMCAYYELYTDTFGLREHIRFETPVEQVRPRADGLWSVRFADGEEAVFKGVVVCNGHHWSRCFPEWTRDFAGQVLHSKDYKRPEELAGKRVLVIGGGNSACDLVSEAARVSERAEWSLRRGYWFTPKTFFGKPTVEMMNPWAPIWLQRLMLKTLIKVVIGPYEDYGLPHPDHEIFEKHPTVSTEIFHYLKHGKISPRPDVASVDGQTVTFTDGTEAEYDVVVCATGFHVDFPMLPEGTVPVHGKTPQLYATLMRPEHRHLYVFGGYQPRYGLGPLVRPAAQMLARFITLQEELEVPLGKVLKALGQRPPPSHLIDPHVALRQMKMARRSEWLVRRKGMQMDRSLGRGRSVPGEAA